MDVCPLCHQEVAESDRRPIASSERRLVMHLACFEDFESLVREVGQVPTLTAPKPGFERLAKEVDGHLILVHRDFPNEQMPFLVYLASQENPAVVTDMYNWAEQNELRIRNPANQILRLKEKNHISTYDRDGKRFAVITDEGRAFVGKFAARLAGSKAEESTA